MVLAPDSGPAPRLMVSRGDSLDSRGSVLDEISLATSPHTNWNDHGSLLWPVRK